MTTELALPRGTRVLLACSGGSDSSAMLHVLAGLRAAHGWDLRAHGVDHGLRQAAAAELEVTASLAASLGVPFGVTRLELSAGPNLQARAREARYAALRLAATRAEARFIATAHTADDRAETVLLRLLRSAPAAGLAVLRPLEGDRLRPLVRARRRDVELHLERHRVPHARDPSNVDPRFLRARVRAELLPLLEALSPRVVETLASLADELVAGAATRAALDELPARHRRVVERALRDGASHVALRTDDAHELRVELDPSGVTRRIVDAPPRSRARSPK